MSKIAPRDHGALVIAKEDLVSAAYRVLLGRQPESEAVVKNTAAAFSNADEILEHFKGSAEYQQRNATNDLFNNLRRGLSAPPARIQVAVSQGELDALFARTRQQWSALGQADPYWSVLTQDRFRLDNIDQHRREFEASGAHAVALLDTATSRSGVEIPRDATVLELGCGVGRVTRFLAERMRRVIGVDISAGNLQLCADYVKKRDLSNVDLVLLNAPPELKDLPEFDVFFTTIVLQHNPPPVIKYMLDVLLAKIRPGGVAYFQVPTHTTDYSFSVDSYLKTPRDVLDMHALPMTDVFASLHGAGLHIREVLMDNWTGMYGSHTFLATKPRR